MQDEFWPDHLSDLMHRGGWPDDVLVDEIEIDDTDPDAPIVVTAALEFKESITTSCANVNVDFDMAANVTLSINRDLGDYEIEIDETYGGDPDDDEPYEGDYY